MANQVKFYQVASLPTTGINPNALYFVTSTHQIYKGSVLYGSSAPNIIKPADGQTTIPAGTYYVGDIAVGFEGGAKVYDGTEWQELSPDSNAIKAIVRGQLEDEAGFTFQTSYETYTSEELEEFAQWDGEGEKPEHVPADAIAAGYYDEDGKLVADITGRKLNEAGALIPVYEATKLEVPLVNAEVVQAETISAANIGTNGLGFAPAGQYTPTKGIMLDSTGSNLLYGTVDSTNNGLVADSTLSALATQAYVDGKVATLDNATHFRGVVSTENAGGSADADADALATVENPVPGDIVLVKETGTEYIYIEEAGEEEGQKVGKWEQFGDQKIHDSISTKIDAMDFSDEKNDNGVAVGLTQVDGQITSLSLTVDAAESSASATMTDSTKSKLATAGAVRDAIDNSMCWYGANDLPISDTDSEP